MDSPVRPTFSPTLSDKKISCISEAPAPPQCHTFLYSPSPPLSSYPDTPSLINPQTFLYSPSISSGRDESPILPAMPSKHTSRASLSDFGGTFPTPHASHLSYDTPSANSEPSWVSGFSTASTCISPQFQYYYRTEHMSDILPDNMDLYARDIEEYTLEPISRFDAGSTTPRGLGLELPFIAEHDFAYYPRPESVSRGLQAEISDSSEYSEQRDNVGKLGKKKNRFRVVFGKLARKALGKMGVKRYVKTVLEKWGV
ncbi:hypothetical protein J1614_004883 [Plenodomus biglobosus]|nr:hypothetical protein J1614_004883 [Plenodomus biglobosus]